MNQIKEFILWVVGIVFVVVIIFVGYSFFSKSNEMSKSADSGLSSVQQSVEAARFSNFENSTCSGSDVISAIRTYATDTFTITVRTAEASTPVNYNASNSYTITNSTNANYIEPTAQFTSTLVRNNNNTVTGISFIQN
jgi:hypothetical protein